MHKRRNNSLDSTSMISATIYLDTKTDNKILTEVDLFINDTLKNVKNQSKQLKSNK